VNTPYRFLIVDDNSDSRFLLVKTLLRKFPTALVLECHDCDTALSTARTDKLTAIVTHRTYDCDGTDLVALLRKANSAVPIVMVSGIDRTPQALAAGANAFLNYDQWLRIGTVVGDVIAADESLAPFAREVVLPTASVRTAGAN
jgi:DNA-binding NtrC family response regulator